MNEIINCILVTACCVMVIDIAKFTDSIKYGIWVFLDRKGSWENIRLKPFDCSLCSSFWVNVIYLFWVDKLTILNITVALFLAILTPIIGDTIWTIRDLMGKLINKIGSI